MNSTTHSVDELWLRALERVAARSAHEIKGALNGVAVNLEVVRSRADKANAPAAAVARFATVAAGQLEAVVDMTEALLALTRAPREPVDVVSTVNRLAALLRPVARADGHALDVEAPPGTAPSAGGTVRGNTVRLAVASALLAGVEGRADVRCRITQNEGEELLVVVEWGVLEHPPAAVESDILEALADAGVRLQITSQGISLAFPR